MKSSLRARKAKRSAVPDPNAAAPAVAQSRFVEIDLLARSRAELDSLASALEHAPPLDREAQRRELFPYHNVASSRQMEAAVLRIIEKRDPDNAWVGVERAMQSVDEAGNGHTNFMALYREVIFQAGIEYAFRSFPDWWAQLEALRQADREAINALVRRVVRSLRQNDRAAEKGGAR
jgi:hypothetical protein